MELQSNKLENNIRVIKLNGALDLNGTYSIEVQFTRICEEDHVRVLVDLTNVNFISSVGIAMLVNTSKSVVGRGGMFALLNPQKAVAYVLELTGISEIIRVFSDLESARSELALN